MYRVKVADNNEIRNSKDAWNLLASKMSTPTIFCTWEWIYTWWEEYGDKYDLLILFIYGESELKGILPLASRKFIMKNDWLTGRLLLYCGSMEVSPDHIDIISSKEEAALCLNAVIQFLYSEYDEWDVLQMSSMTEGNNFLTWLINDHTYYSDIKQSSISPYIPLPEKFEQYLDQFHSKKKYNLKKMERIFDQQSVTYDSCGLNQLENQEALKALFKLHGSRAARKKIISAFQGASIVDFHEKLLEKLQSTNWLWLKMLRYEKNAIAVLYGFAFGDRIDYYQIGLDPAWEKYGPGKFLFYNSIREACVGNYREFDFLRGGESYKFHWTKNYRRLMTANVYNKSCKGRLSRTLYSTKLVLKNMKHHIMNHLKYK